MRLKKANREESPGRFLDAHKRIQEQAASTASCQVVRGVTKLEHPGSTPTAVSSRLLCRDVNEINDLVARSRTYVVASLDRKRDGTAKLRWSVQDAGHEGVPNLF
jgi:hypothetical protein